MFSTSFKQAKNQWTKVGEKLFVFKDPVEVGDNFDSCLGFYDPGKKLMVKRMLISDENSERMDREIKWMEDWEKHQNILDWVSLDQDDSYLYLSQDRWSFTLETLVKYLHSLGTTTRLPCPEALGVFIQKNNVTLNKGYIDGLMVDLMKDVSKGLNHLHQMKYVHRDLRPQNIVIVCGTKSMSAKIANFCFTYDSKLNSKERSKLKKLYKSKTDFQPVEQKHNYSRWEGDKSTEQSIPLETYESDLYSFGCLLYYSLTLGGRPYGAIQSQLHLFKCKNEEAKGLLAMLLHRIPDSRAGVPLFNNPLFWSFDQKLNFLKDVSDLMNTSGHTGTMMVGSVELRRALFVGNGNWEKLIHVQIVTHLKNDHQKRTGDPLSEKHFESVRSLIRLIRNQYNHFFELSVSIKAIYNGTLEGMLDYYSRRFPSLLITVYMAFCQIKDLAFEELRRKYYT